MCGLPKSFIPNLNSRTNPPIRRGIAGVQATQSLEWSDVRRDLTGSRVRGFLYPGYGVTFLPYEVRMATEMLVGRGFMMNGPT